MRKLSQSTQRAALLAAAIIALVFGALAALEAENRTYTGYRVSDGSRVLRVDHDSPGAAAGLRVGDVISSLNGMPAANRKELQELQRRAPAAGAWRMEVERNGGTVRLEISPTGLPANEIRLARTRSLLGLFFLGFPFWAWFISPGSTALLLAIFGLSFGFLLMGAPYFESSAVRSILDGVAILALYTGMTALVHFLLAFPSRRPFLGAAYFLSAIVLLVWRYVAASRAERAKHGLGIMLLGTLAAFVPLLLYPVVTSLFPGSARYYKIISSTYSPPLTLVLIPIAFSVAAVRSARSKGAA